MKRDMDLVRDILLTIENSETGQLRTPDLAILCYSEEKLRFQIKLMVGGQYLDELVSKPHPVTGSRWHGGYSITWKGFDFLDSVRDPEIWQKTKESAKVAGGFTVDLLGDIAKGLIKTQLKKLTGVEI